MVLEQSKPPKVATPDMLKGLPEPARRYLEYTGIVGQPWIDTVRITHSGRFRLAADRPWLPLRAKQVYRTDPPAFRWKARMKMVGLWLVSGSDT
jgi:Family of unknown function (DUF6544)